MTSDLDDDFFEPSRSGPEELVSVLPEVGSEEWIEWLQERNIEEMHETQADYRDEDDMNHTTDDSDEEPKRSSPAEPAAEKPPWDDRVGIPDDYPRGHPLHKGGEVYNPWRGFEWFDRSLGADE